MPIKIFHTTLPSEPDTQSFSSLVSGLWSPHTDYILNGTEDPTREFVARPSVLHPVTSKRRALLGVPARTKTIFLF